MRLTTTLTKGLDTYSIGPKLRELRHRKGMGLVELGRHSGLSPALLSKIERGKMYPTLPTLLRISLVFSVGLGHFFTERPPAVAVVRKQDRLSFPEKPDETDVPYHFESLDFSAKERRFNSYLAKFESKPVEDVKLHTHDGDELLFVVTGKLGLYVEDQEWTLGPEDSAYLDARRPHGYRRIGDSSCVAVVVVSQ